MLTRARWLPCGHAVTLLAELGQSREEILPIRVGQASEMPESPPALEPLGRGFTASHHDGQFSPFSPGLVQRRARTAEPTARRSQLIPEFLPWCLLESGYPPCNTNSCFTARAAWRGEFSLSPSIPASCSLDWWAGLSEKFALLHCQPSGNPVKAQWIGNRKLCRREQSLPPRWKGGNRFA